ncbi:cell wall protein [Micromonospora soli]|uniref:cell wall protein n=1 Tax=Micromonospora sp. NBRC 110009 TaxID=3061627 RepID=UPI00267178D4|nr:cell wall protein [Micromonospora sp. NBRC 110009]WKU00462.1 cell wall protein [Micromonospora sp. NBRC 110009]
MHQTLDRRRLLATAALGGVVGATGLGSLAPEAAFAAQAATVEPGAPDPNFAEGRISKIFGNMLLVSGSDAVLHAIRITDGTSIWKLHPTTFDRVAVGDGLYARGVRLPDGTLAADAVWVNIVNLHGHIAAVGRNVLHLDHKGQRIVAHVVPGRSAAIYNGTPAVSDMSLLRVGRHVQVLGAWHPDTNEIDIATVYAAA